MAVNSILTPLQLTAGAGLLQNEGISPYIINAAVTAYTSTNLISPLANAFSVGSTGNILSANTIASLVTIASNSCPALSDSIPSASTGYPTELLSTLLSNTASTYLGNGDDSKFAQAFSIAQSYNDLTNQFINSAKNATTYLGPTFTNTNNMISGSITAVNLCTPQWGEDLANLGLLINLSNLANLGSPAALMKQLATIGGVVPVISIVFAAAGVDLETVVNLTDTSLTVTTPDEKAMYTAMTAITGDPLTQVLQLFGVKTAGIETMADLLNPYKLFPNSFQTLTVINKNNVSQRIYTSPSGNIDSTLSQTLPQVLSLDRLTQILPSDIALANKALAISMLSIVGINNLSLPMLAKTVANVQPLFGLPLINAQTAPISQATADYYQNTLAIGTGTNGTITITDVLGTAIGWVSADALANSVAVINSMPALGSSGNANSLIGIYTSMANAANGVYGDPVLGPVDIPSGPAAGIYANCDVAFAGDLMGGIGLIPAAQSTVANVVTDDPANVAILNSNWTNIMNQLDLERESQALCGLTFSELQANSRSSIYSFVLSLPQYGQDTTVGGTAEFIQDVCDLNTLTGQAIIAVMRQGQTRLDMTGITSTSDVPSDPNPPPAQAQLLPSHYPYP